MFFDVEDFIFESLRYKCSRHDIDPSDEELKNEHFRILDFFRNPDNLRVAYGYINDINTKGSRVKKIYNKVHKVISIHLLLSSHEYKIKLQDRDSFSPRFRDDYVFPPFFCGDTRTIQLIDYFKELIHIWNDRLNPEQEFSALHMTPMYLGEKIARFQEGAWIARSYTQFSILLEQLVTSYIQKDCLLKSVGSVGETMGLSNQKVKFDLHYAYDSNDFPLKNEQYIGSDVGSVLKIINEKCLICCIPNFKNQKEKLLKEKSDRINYSDEPMLSECYLYMYDKETVVPVSRKNIFYKPEREEVKDGEVKVIHEQLSRPEHMIALKYLMTRLFLNTEASRVEINSNRLPEGLYRIETRHLKTRFSQLFKEYGIFQRYRVGRSDSCIELIQKGVDKKDDKYDREDVDKKAMIFNVKFPCHILFVFTDEKVS